MPPSTLIIRADANTAMGTGHAMRCLALAHAWHDAGGRTVFAMADVPAILRARLISDNIEIADVDGVAGDSADAGQLAELARQYTAPWVVVDGYQFDADYQRSLKAAGLKVLFVDDNGHAKPYSADIVLNQNCYAEEKLYRDRQPDTRLLLGSRYAMLRRDFARWINWKREIPPVGSKVLVTMGGSDSQNVTENIIRALHLLKVPFEAKVIIGSGYPHQSSLENRVGRLSSKVELIRNPTEMPDVMAWADIAITAAGSTCWELCLLGLPSILVDVAPNQSALAQELGTRGIAIHVGRAGEVSPERIAAEIERLLGSPQLRTAFSCRGRELVDGLGAARVVSATLGLKIRLRPAEERDCRLLSEWVNDPHVRAASFSTRSISWEEHLAWFKRKQNDRNCRILIGEDEHGHPVGQFRVDWRADGEGQIDVSIAPQYRGLSYGGLLVELGTSSAFSETKGKRLHAFVRPDNQPSRRIFERAGFKSLGKEVVNGQDAVHYICEALNEVLR